MNPRRTPIYVHLLGAALAAALVAYWALRLLVHAEAPVPAAGPAALVRDPDPSLAARLFGDLNSGPAVTARNIQVSGVFASGRASSAVIAVDGRPPRAVLIGQEAAPGLRLVDVRDDGVTLDGDGARSSYSVPPIALARPSSPAPGYRREGNTLTAPSLEAAPNLRPGAPARLGGPAAPPPPSGMLVPPPQRGAPDEPGAGARPAPGGFNNPPATAPGI